MSIEGAEVGRGILAVICRVEKEESGVLGSYGAGELEGGGRKSCFVAGAEWWGW